MECRHHVNPAPIGRGGGFQTGTIAPLGGFNGKSGRTFMRKIDESERPMPEIDLAKVCFIIEKSCEYVGEEVGAEADDSNPADDDERVMLTEAAGPSIRREL